MRRLRSFPAVPHRLGEGFGIIALVPVGYNDARPPTTTRGRASPPCPGPDGGCSPVGVKQGDHRLVEGPRFAGPGPSSSLWQKPANVCCLLASAVTAVKSMPGGLSEAVC